MNLEDCLGCEPKIGVILLVLDVIVEESQADAGERRDCLDVVLPSYEVVIADLVMDRREKLRDQEMELAAR